ncbi:insulinase family protein [Longimicrobium sp.]|uniref:M16 family metallopeptidase n=1 Tax=Longimicrobium sp. TaxID=2029185 RepID=UPI002E318653|nr:insulinase family protein [Longimicrobium sp.]HEX6040154.1 insulinase family protein [Longimicrobium sp.]
MHRFHALPLAVLALAACASTQTPAPSSDAPTEAAASAAQPRVDLRGDTAVVRGTLPNGLTYYVRRNAEPRARAELRLVVNAGSVLEDADQRGLAHFLEHMAFNGTRRFQEHEIVNYLERVGMRFGPDVNAYTSFDETVYMLQLPTDSAGVLDTGLQILRDWATDISLDSAEIEAERGVVMEEWRLSRGAGGRVSDRQFPFLFAGSRYAERLPIGDTSTLRTFRPATLRRFYERWYRPELMAVVAVGDFDPREIEARIREEFGGIPASAQPVDRPETTLPFPDSTRYMVTVDPELPRGQVSINWMIPDRPDTAVADVRRGIVEGIYAGMLGDRMNEITLRPDAPFLDVGSYQGASLRPLETFVLTASVAEGGTERGLAGLTTEVERAARHGFTAAELEREKADLLRLWEQIYAERAKTTSGQFASQYAEHFLRGGVLRTVEDDYALQTALVPAITLDEVNAAARRIAAHRDRAVLVTGPAREGLAQPTEARLALVADSVARAPLDPWTETLSDAPLLARAPTPGRVVEVDSVTDVGVIRWTLSNGARVVLKPTDFKDDEILFAATSQGGLSLLPDSLYRYGQTATAAVQLGGVGELSLTDLQKRLTGKAASVGSNVSEYSEGMNGFAAPRDVETLFQLVHLYFTQPRRDTASWTAYLQRGREALRNRGVTPESAFGDTLNAILSQNHVRARPFTTATFDSLDIDRSLAIYRERFADAGDFTFYFVGRFDPDSLRPLAETYLASLPGTGSGERWRDIGIRPPAGVVRRTVRRGVEPKARTALVFTGPAEFSREATAEISGLAQALEIRLRERLREDLGGTYGVGVSGGVERDPYARYSFIVNFGSAPERVDELTGVVFAVLDSVRAAGPTQEEVDKVREAARRSRETALRENDFWLGRLLSYDRMGWDIRMIDDEPLSAGLTVERLRDAARRYLDRSRYVQVSLVPENGPAAGGGDAQQ